MTLLQGIKYHQAALNQWKWYDRIQNSQHINSFVYIKISVTKVSDPWSETFVTVKQAKYIDTGLINHSEKLNTNSHITTDKKGVFGL